VLGDRVRDRLANTDLSKSKNCSLNTWLHGITIMTALPEIKYNIGQTVYKAGWVVERRAHKCPDCLGSGEWEAMSPAGTKYKMPCPRCRVSYRSNHELSLNYSWYVPLVSVLTIGSVRLDTYDEDEPVSYMCLETGVGGGQIHRQNTLFLTHEEAEQAGLLECAKINADSKNWVAKQYNDTLQYCDYQLDNAVLKSANALNSELRAKAQILFYDLGDCETLEEVKKRIEKGWSDDEE